MKKYTLSDSEIRQIANLAVQENGESAVADEVSLMANLFELQTKYTNIYNYIRNGGWFSRAAHYMDNGSSSSNARAIVKDVLVNGNRTLPAYINEHDCFSDITSATNYGSAISKTNRSSYIKDVTIIKNRYGSTYIFYKFPTPYSDPFGYTASAYNKIKGKDNSSEPAASIDTLSGYTFTPFLVKKGSQGQSVLAMQTLLKGLGYKGSNGKALTLDGDCGSNTIYALKNYQSKKGLTTDGECGKKTWTKLLG